MMALDLSGGGNIGGVSFASLGLLLTKADIPLLPTTRQIEEEIPGRDGSIDLETRYGARPIELTFEFTETEEIAYQNNLSKVAGAFNALKGEQILVLERNPGKQWRVKYNGSISIEKLAQIGTFTVPLKAFNPFAESYNKADEPLKLGEGFTLGMGYKLTDNSSTTYSVTSNLTTLTVPHFGNHAAKPIITITGTGSNLTITNDSTEEGFTWSGTLSANDTLVVDCDKMSIKKNGNNAFANFSGDYITLGEGDNSITVTATSPNLTVDFDYRHTYLY